MPSLGSGLSLGTLNTISGYDYDANAFINLAGISDSDTIYNLNGQKAFRFNGSTKLTASTSALNITGDSSFSFWLKPSLSATASGGNQVFISKGAYASNGYYFQIQATTLRANFNQSGSNAFFGSNSMYMNSPPVHDFTEKWVYVVFTYKFSTRVAKIYRNGALMETYTFAFNPANPGTSEFAIGVLNSGGGAEYTGSISNLGFWTTELTQANVTSLYNSGEGLSYENLGSLTTNLTNYYKLSETTGSAVDSVSGVNLTLTGTRVLDTAPIGVLETISPRKQLNDFIKGAKTILGADWNNSIFWPMRSMHNKSSGSIVHSFGGYGNYDATMTSPGSFVRTKNGLLSTTKLNGLTTAFPIVAGSASRSIFSLSRSFALSASDSFNPIAISPPNSNRMLLRSNSPTTMGADLYNGTSFDQAFFGVQRLPWFTFSNLGYINTLGGYFRNNNSVVESVAVSKTFATSVLNMGGYVGSNIQGSGTYVLNGYSLTYLDQQQHNSLYSLIKETIGYGLDLA
jgi:hypothetical protein